MDPAADPIPPALPDSDEWASVGVRVEGEVHAGHQSRVVRADRAGQKIVVKLVDARFVDRAFVRRVVLTSRIAEVEPSVVGPIPLGSDLVVSLGGWLAVAYPFVTGSEPGLEDAGDVARMAAGLAALHEVLASVDDPDIPPVAALRGQDVRVGGSHQLLHGDYSNANVRLAGEELRIFDFDDCGHGPVEFEIGNSLYMVLFDATMAGEPRRYRRFREWFVESYSSAAGIALDEEAIDRSIEIRIDALRRWVEDPDHAPIGIRTASPEWRRRLQSFVGSN